MSNITREAKHPETGEVQVALWIDNYYGKHKFAVRFPDGSIYPESEVEDAPAED